MKRSDVVELFTRLRELDPHPTTELLYTSPFELLVAVVLSAQATDVGVNKATKRLFPVARTPATILALGEDGLKRYIATIGLYNAKAKNIIATSALLIERLARPRPVSSPRYARTTARPGSRQSAARSSRKSRYCVIAVL